MVMATSEMLSSFLKAADVAKNFLGEFGRNIPLLLSSLLASLFVCIDPLHLIPSPIGEFRWMFAAISVFLLSYFILLLWFSNRHRRQVLWHLKRLGRDEQQVLAGYLKEDKTVRYFDMFHGPACSLVARGILIHAAGVVPMSDAPYAIQPYILVYLRKHPGIIGLKTEEVGKDELSDERNIEATFGAESNE